MLINDLKKINEYVWEIPKEFRKNMLVPGRVFATEKMLQDILKDRSLEQLVNVAYLKGIVKYAMVMPDSHEGYGFPIGGVAATKLPDGFITPGGIGYDINCGVRLLLSDLDFETTRPRLESLIRKLFQLIPSGVGRGGNVNINKKELDEVLQDGAAWAVRNNFGNNDDLECIESSGRLASADPATVSDHAKKRGIDQLGTLGAGNHFVEADKVEEIFDEKAARAFGLQKNQIVVLLHTGSRGLGHQVATDYIRVMLQAMSREDIRVPDPELAGMPFSSSEGKRYFSAMAAAANFAWANRQIITSRVRQAWQEIFSGQNNLRVLYDVAHNIAKIEDHMVDGKEEKLIVHRKGATRSFGPGHGEIPLRYRAFGQPVIIPGSMGTASFVLAGTQKAMQETFGSTCHGAGRRMSRHEAKRKVSAEDLKSELLSKGIHYVAGSLGGMLEEAPLAYKDIDEVVDVVHNAGLALKVAKLRPVAVMKG